MQNIVSPETLDDLDRRVYDLAVQSMPLAEIAVRLGMPVAQADERIQRVCMRLRVADRAALRKLAEQPSSAELATEDDVLGAEPDSGYVAVADRGMPTPRRIGRRAFLAAGSAVVAGTGSVAGLMLIRRGNRRSAAHPDNSGTAQAPPNGESFASRLAEGPGQDEGVFIKSWGSGDTIEWPEGLFLMSPATGQITGHRFVAQSQEQWFQYRTFSEDRFVAAQSNLGHGVFFDRYEPSRTWWFDADRFRLVAIAGYSSGKPSTAYLLFQEMNDGTATGVLQVARLIDSARVESHATLTVLDGPGGFYTFRQQPRGMRVAAWLGTGSAYDVWVIDLEQPALRDSFELYDPADPKAPAVLPGALQAIDDGFIASWATSANGRGDFPRRFFSVVLGWDGKQVGAVREDTNSTFWARNGLWRAVETAQRTVVPQGAEGSGENWPSVGVSLGSPGGTSARIRSAYLNYGDGPASGRWLPDMTGFLAMVRGPEIPLDAANSYQYAIVSPDGRAITRLPTPPRPVGKRQWFEQEWIRGPVPSPYDSNFLSFGRLHLYNRRTGAWFSASIPPNGGPDHLDPWSAGPGFMAFALPHGGHGGGDGPILLAPRFELPPYDDSFEMEVVNTGDGLNLREQPALGAKVTALLPDGEQLTLVDVLDPAFGQGQKNVERTNEATWVYVQRANGQRGWASSAYLAWT